MKILTWLVNSHFYSMNWIHILTKLRHLEIKYDTTISSKTLVFY